MVVRHNSKRIRKNTGFSVLEKHWDGYRVKPNLRKEKKNNHQLINVELQGIENKVHDIFLHLKAHKIPFSSKIFNSLYNNDKEALNDKHNFFEIFEKYIDEGRLVKSKNTTKGQVTVKNFIRAFSTEVMIDVSFEAIDDDFFNDIRKYAFEVRKIKQNYFAKIISVLKSFLNWATEKGYNSNRNYEKFKAPEHDVDIIYLTFDELMRLFNHEFENKRLSHVRDIYCLGCFTGLRYSDLSKLHLANISENHIIISVQKTKTQNHAIKLNKYAKAILEKYRGTIYEPLPTLSSQKFNDYIKECCELAEIDHPVTVHWFVGNKKQNLTQPKYKFITSHTARKTFITNSLLLGMEPKAIKKIANIKKDAVLDKYMKVTEAFTDEQMDNAWN